jgi:uncharacterized protein YndB with AHSA1/START domain
MTIDHIRSSIIIEAEPTEVFEYFIRSDAMVLWMGQSADLDPVPGGRFSVDVNGAAVRGRFVELDPPNRIVFTWGFLDSDELPPETSIVEVSLSRDDGGTLVEIVHSGLSDSEIAKHGIGWPYFLDQLAEALTTQRKRKVRGR